MQRPALIGLAIAAAVAVLVALSSVYTVHQSEQALVLQFGEPQRVVKEPGLHFKVPFIQNVVVFSNRVLNFDAPAAEVPTVDQKQVVVDAFARFRITDPLRFFQTVTNEAGVQARLRSIISSTLRGALGEVPLDFILTNQRGGLMQQIAEQVNVEAQTFGINVVDVRIKRLDLPEENSQAIFRRMQTQREQEARRIRAEGARDAQTIRAEADKQSVVILANARRTAEILRGEGDAQATAIYNDAYGQDPTFFDFYRSMQALKEGLPSETTTFVGPPDGDFFRFFGQGPGESQASASTGGNRQAQAE
ncbi:protease modulator HflC [Rhodospirillaceae bacterium SYSU D60014]|uniref:protease modulator HflC n=1 Tax=Virgifigura deserti TaxID=2268457 RepID=UPI000E666505